MNLIILDCTRVPTIQDGELQCRFLVFKNVLYLLYFSERRNWKEVWYKRLALPLVAMASLSGCRILKQANLLFLHVYNNFTCQT